MKRGTNKPPKRNQFAPVFDPVAFVPCTAEIKAARLRRCGAVVRVVLHAVRRELIFEIWGIELRRFWVRIDSTAGRQREK